MKFVKPDIQKIIAFVNGLSKRERMILYFTTVFIIIVASDRLIISPVVSEMTSIGQRVQHKENEITRGLHILANKSRIVSEIATYEPFLNEPAEDEEGITELLKEIENIASNNAVFVISIRPAGITTEGPAKKFSVALDCESGMEDLVAFMYEIENAGQIYVIEKIQISPKSGDISVIQCGMTISRVNIF